MKNDNECGTLRGALSGLIFKLVGILSSSYKNDDEGKSRPRVRGTYSIHFRGK
jgi:hypothetical protein